MRSPFPGMDPYLEQFWPDIHASLIIYIRDQLEEQLPESLIARVEERVVLETELAEPRSIYPDVKITQRVGARNGAKRAESGLAVMEPIIVESRSEPTTETFINVVEAGEGGQLVTVIEVLSPSNKLPGDGQLLYRQKQRELKDAGVSLVEIDLLREGHRVVSIPASQIPRRAHTTYLACVRRGWRPGQWELYPMPLRSALPAIRIPLRESDDDIRLNLQAILDQAYRKGRYHLTIDYTDPAEPPLEARDGKWAKGRLKPARRKKSS